MASESSKNQRILKRISTGIVELDSLIEGGFEEHSINLVAGSTGAGKTIFALQFLIEGMKKGEKAVYVTFEETREELYKDMYEIGWDLAKYDKEGLLVFISYPPMHVKQLLAQGGGILEEVVERKKPARIVIDSITSFSLLYKDELERKTEALQLFEMIRKWKCTALLTCEEDELAGNFNYVITADLECEVDSVTLLYNLISKEGIRKRAMEILKMRGTRHLRNVMAFDIKDDKGIVLKPNEQIQL